MTKSLGPANFDRYNRVNFCTKMTNLTTKTVRYNRVFVNNRVHYNRPSFNVTEYKFLAQVWKPKLDITM
jgi:hypothetical protein